MSALELHAQEQARQVQEQARSQEEQARSQESQLRLLRQSLASMESRHQKLEAKCASVSEGGSSDEAGTLALLEQLRHEHGEQQKDLAFRLSAIQSSQQAAESGSDMRLRKLEGAVRVLREGQESLQTEMESLDAAVSAARAAGDAQAKFRKLLYCLSVAVSVSLR